MGARSEAKTVILVYVYVLGLSCARYTLCQAFGADKSPPDIPFEVRSYRRASHDADALHLHGEASPYPFPSPQPAKSADASFSTSHGLCPHMFDSFLTEETVPGQACVDQDPRGALDAVRMIR